MALDLYTGTLTRYYRREWQTVGELEARGRGDSYVRITAGERDESEPPPPVEEVRAKVLEWRNLISESLVANGLDALQWDESDDRPWFTDRPQWDGFAALVLWAAYAEHTDLAPPADLPEEWHDDPAYLRCTKAAKPRFHTILLPEWWLPMSFNGVFGAPTPAFKEKTKIGSIDTLAVQLDALEAADSPAFGELSKFGLEAFRRVVAQAREHRLPMLLDY